MVAVAPLEIVSVPAALTLLLPTPSRPSTSSREPAPVMVRLPLEFAPYPTVLNAPEVEFRRSAPPFCTVTVDTAPADSPTRISPLVSTLPAPSTTMSAVPLMWAVPPEGAVSFAPPSTRSVASVRVSSPPRVLVPANRNSPAPLTVRPPELLKTAFVSVKPAVSMVIGFVAAGMVCGVVMAKAPVRVIVALASASALALWIAVFRAASLPAV